MGLIVIDAGVLIGFLDGGDAHHASAHRALAGALERGDTVAMPASALAETLVGPSRRGPHAVSAVHNLVASLPIVIVALDETIAVTAADLRARHPSLKLPDSLVIATASARRADILVTTDRRWPTRVKLGLRASIVNL